LRVDLSECAALVKVRGLAPDGTAQAVAGGKLTAFRETAQAAVASTR